MIRDPSSGFILPYTLIVLAAISFIASAGLASLRALSDREIALIERTDALFDIETRKASVLFEEIALESHRDVEEREYIVVCLKRDEASFVRPWGLDARSASRVMRGAEGRSSLLLDAYRRRFADGGEERNGLPVTRNLYDLDHMPGWNELHYLWSEGVALTEFSMYGSASFNVSDASPYALEVVLGLDGPALEQINALIEAGAMRSRADLSLVVPAVGEEAGVLAPQYTFDDSDVFSLFLASEDLLFGTRFVYQIEPSGLTAPFREIDRFALDAAALRRLGDLVNDGNDIPTPWRCAR